MLRKLIAISVLMFLIGCGTNKEIKVSGTVSIDGVPIERGTIQFLPADGVGPDGGGVITDGKFTATVFPGEKTVRVRGRKIVGKKTIVDPSIPLNQWKDEANARTATIDIEKEVTNDQKHWDHSTLKIKVTSAKEPLSIELTN